ncbi:MAG: hypothetical protein WC436_03115 [Candidatus Babeliales bacterium]
MKKFLFGGILSTLCFNVFADSKDNVINCFNQNVCFFNAVNKDPIISIFDKDAKKIKIIVCGCKNTNSNSNSKIKEDSDIARLTSIETIELLYTINKKTEHIYDGKRKGFGKGLEKVLCLTQVDNQNYLFDELKRNAPNSWTLNNAEQAKYLKEYLEKSITKENFVPIQKTLLLLKVVDDPELKTLDKDVKEFFEKFYDMYTLSNTSTTNKDIKEFFEKIEQEFYDKCVDMGGSSPEHINESVRESILMQTEKNFKKFDGAQLAALCGVFITTTWIGSEIREAIAVTEKRLISHRSLAEAVMDKICPEK